MHAAGASLFSPRSLLADAGLWATSLLGVAARHVICGFSLFFPPSYVALPDSKPFHRPTGKRVSWYLETSPPSWLPPQDRSLSLTLLALFLSFIFCPSSFWRECDAFLGGWCPLPAFRSCSVEFVQRSNDLSMNVWGRKCSILWHLVIFYKIMLYGQYYLSKSLNILNI